MSNLSLLFFLHFMISFFFWSSFSPTLGFSRLAYPFQVQSSSQLLNVCSTTCTSILLGEAEVLLNISSGSLCLHLQDLSVGCSPIHSRTDTYPICDYIGSRPISCTTWCRDSLTAVSTNDMQGRWQLTGTLLVLQCTE